MAEQTKKAKRSKKAKIPKTADIVTKFENQTSRLSLNKSLLDIYDDKGTIFHTPSDPIDMGKWTFEFDDVEEKEENRYGLAINSGGNPEGKSEITSIGKTTFLGSVSSNIQDAGASATSNRAHNEHEQFKLNMEAAMRANNMNSTGMINDTKRKEHIDLIAGGRNEQVDQFVNKTGKHEDFSKNVKLKYEDKYTDNPTHRSKKKVSDFKRGSASKEDGYNKLYPLPDEMNKIPTEDLTWKDWDFIPFILHDLVNRKYLPFRSFINSISDQSDAEWQDIRYLGRADNVQVYTGFARTLSIDFTTVAFTLEELHPMWQRLNYLVGLTKPAGYTSFANDEAVIPTSAFIIPPFVKFNLGDMYKDQPCVMTSVSLSIPQEASWELTPDGKTKNEYDFLNKTITKSNQLVGQYPDMVQVSMSFKLLEKRLPKTNNRHFGHYRKEDDPENQDIPDDGPDIKKGFNYNLIYPNPQTPEKNMVGMNDPNEEPVDPSKKGIGGDPFEGNSEGVCTTYPPSHYYLSRGNKSKKKEEEIQQELEEWKQCACEQTAKLMGLGDPDKVPNAEDDTGTRTHSLMDARAKETLERTGKSHTCTWNDNGCIESVNGTKVPAELECKYNTFTNEEPTEEENPKPPRCPSPVGGLHEKDYNQRVIGYTESNEFEQRKNDKGYMDGLRNRNLAYWIKDVSDYLATEMNSPKIGNGAYTYNSKSGLIPKYSQIKKVSSSNGSVVLEFDDNGHPFSYAGKAVNRNISQDFKIDCEDEDFNEIREIAGNLQPKIIVDTESNFKIILNEDRGHVITKDNYDNINGIRRWLASWVSSEMRWVIPSANEPEGRTTWKDSFLNLKGKWADDVWTEYDIYYAPYEDDPEEQSIAYKVFPGTSEYVNYEIDTNISENLGLDAGGPKYAELKFGFYAIVSKEKEKLSTRDPDRWFEQDLADKLYEKLFVDMNHFVGNASKLGSENTGLAGDGTELQTDESTRDFLNPTNSGNEEKLLLLKEKKATEARVDAQLLNENIICIDYTLVGKWNPTQASEIMSRMKNMSYQPLIKEKRQLGSARIDIENYVILMLGTTEKDIQAADVAYQTASRKGRLVAEDRELARFTEQDFLQAEIERIEADMEKNTADSTDEFADFKHGVFFSSPDSDNHFEPWVRDHKYDKIEWRDGSNTLPDDPRPGRKPKVIGEPRPTTESPTPNTKPTWTWKPVESAIQYDVEFPPGIHSIVSTNFFKPTDEFPSLKKLEYKTYTIKVKAGRRAHGSGEMEWSTAGIHTVAINKKAIPPKPPRCPYKVMDVGEKDEHDRLIGPASYDEPLETTIERNVKTWMGDVMAYIMAKEELGVLEYPSNPENIVWNTNNERAVSMSGRNQLEWTYNGNTITNLGFDNELEEIAEPGFPTRLNGTALGAAEDGSLKYANEFDCGCGPSLQTDADSGSNTNEPADLELDSPSPSSNETTTNMKPRWTWKPVRGANMYEVSLRKVKANHNADGRGNANPWITEEDMGTIQFSDSKKANPPFSLDVGTYEISVVALYQENGQVTKKSNAGTHIVKVIGGGTPTPTQTPTPTGEYMKLIKDASVGNNGIYVNDRSCIEVGGTITINRNDKQEEAIVTGFAPRQKVTSNATGLGSWGYNYTAGNDPVQLTINSQSDQIARMLVDILKLRSDANCSESDLSKIKDCFFGKDCKFPSFEAGIARYNNEQLSSLSSSLKTALSASVGRGSSDLPARWFFSAAKIDTSPFGVSADLIAYDSNIFGSQLKDILDTAVNTHLDAEVEAQTATGEGLVILQSGIKFDHEENTKVICGEAPLQPTPTPVSIPTSTPTPIKSLRTPQPNSPTPTNNKTVVWHWLPVDNASVYEVSVKKLEPSSGTGTAGKMNVIWDEVMWERPETEFNMTFMDDGYYEISVIAKNTILKLDSAPGTHMVYINEDITPTPTPTPTKKSNHSEIKPVLHLDKETGVCGPLDFEGVGKAMEYDMELVRVWYTLVAKWVCAEHFESVNPSLRILEVTTSTYLGASSGLDLIQPDNLDQWSVEVDVKHLNETGDSEEVRKFDGKFVAVLAKQYGFGLSDSSSTLDELCGGALKLTEPANVGATNLTVNWSIEELEENGFKVDDYILLSPSRDSEELAQIDSFGSIIVKSGLKNEHGYGALIIKSNNPVTPTPTITTTITPSESECDMLVYGNDLYLEQESGYCPDNDESALTRWWTRAIEYCVCKWWNSQPKSVRESKGLYRIYNFPFSVSAYTNEFSVKLEDFHNPQNITASSPIKRSANYEIQVQFTQGKFPSKQGFENIPWSELYPHWKAKGFTRFDPSKGEQCPFSDSETPTPTSQFECPEIISDLNEYPGYCPNPSDEVALEYWKQVIKYYLCKKIKDRYGESAYIKSYNFKATGRRTTILHSPAWLGNSGSDNWLPFETTCTVVKPDGTTTTSGHGHMTASAKILKRDISPIQLTGNRFKCKELNSTPTPSPTPIASAENPFVVPSFYLDQVDGICENTESMKNDWYAAVAKWVVADDYLENFPSYIIRTAISTFSGKSAGLDKPNDLKEWPAMIKLKYYNRDTKSEEESEVSYREVNSLAKQNGFGLSDPSKSLTELCNSDHPEFGNFLEEIEAFSRDKAYKDGDKVFYPTANKNAFFNSFDNEDKYLTLQEGISKYSNDPNFTIYQVHWEDIQNLTRFIDSTGRPTTEDKVPPVNLVILSDKDTDNSLKRNGYTESQIIKWKLGNPGRNVRDTPNTSRFWLSNTSEMKPKSEAVRGPAKESLESEDF